MLRDIDK